MIEDYKYGHWSEYRNLEARIRSGAVTRKDSGLISDLPDEEKKRIASDVSSNQNALMLIAEISDFTIKKAVVSNPVVDEKGISQVLEMLETDEEFKDMFILLSGYSDMFPGILTRISDYVIDRHLNTEADANANSQTLVTNLLSNPQFPVKCAGKLFRDAEQENLLVNNPYFIPQSDMIRSDRVPLDLIEDFAVWVCRYYDRHCTDIDTGEADAAMSCEEYLAMKHPASEKLLITLGNSSISSVSHKAAERLRARDFDK